MSTFFAIICAAIFNVIYANARCASSDHMSVCLRTILSLECKVTVCQMYPSQSHTESRTFAQEIATTNSIIGPQFDLVQKINDYESTLLDTLMNISSLAADLPSATRHKFRENNNTIWDQMIFPKTDAQAKRRGGMRDSYTSVGELIRDFVPYQQDVSIWGRQVSSEFLPWLPFDQAAGSITNGAQHILAGPFAVLLEGLAVGVTDSAMKLSLIIDTISENLLDPLNLTSGAPDNLLLLQPPNFQATRVSIAQFDTTGALPSSWADATSKAVDKDADSIADADFNFSDSAAAADKGQEQHDAKILAQISTSDTLPWLQLDNVAASYGSEKTVVGDVILKFLQKANEALSINGGNAEPFSRLEPFFRAIGQLFGGMSPGNRSSMNSEKDDHPSERSL